MVSLSWWKQYIRFLYPGLRLSRCVQDACDMCVRLDIELQRVDLSSAQLAELILQKEMHLDAAIAQRRFISEFTREFAGKHAPDQLLPWIIIADSMAPLPPDEVVYDLCGSIDDSIAFNVVNADIKIQIEIEDFGGSFPLPHYGSVRPSVDYFQSNLMMQNFVIADLSNGINHVLLYDERGQGKGVDALCSLRLRHHLEIAKKPYPPKILLMILDNCVGQNKSQGIMQFFAILSLLLYEKVVIVFLLPGHSHNAADRVVAHCRNAIRKENLYHPMEIIERWNAVKSIAAEFLNHEDRNSPFYCG